MALPVLILPYFFLVGICAVLAQMVLPLAFPLLDLGGFGSALMPLVVIYVTLELGDERAPVLAGLFGLLLDLTSQHRMGTSILLLSGLSVLVLSQARRPQSQQWVMRALYVLVGTFLYCLFDYIFVMAEAWRWTWPLGVWSKIVFACLLNLILSFPIFFAIGFIPRLCGWKPFYEEQVRPYA